jgi:rSAM/selenodomain-associated transferase 2
MTVVEVGRSDPSPHEPPALSVIIPVLDEAEHIAAVLADAAMRCPGAELIVVDGGSRDGTAQTATRHPGVRVLASVPGRARQMNAGARVASGAIFLFLHADTRLPPDAAALVARAMAQPGAVAGRFDVRFDSRRPVLAVVAMLMNARSRWSRICTGDQAIFVRRDAFEALGGYPDIPLMEDVELTRRLKRVGRIACLRERVVTAARKWEREGAWRTIGLMWRLRLLYALGVDPARLHRMYYRRTPVGPGGDPFRGNG